MGDSSTGEGGSNIRNLTSIIQATKDKFNQLHINDKRWPCPFCIIISKTKIRCRIHIKRDHPILYNRNEEEFSQLTQVETTPEENLLDNLIDYSDNPNSAKDAQSSQCDDNLKKCIHCPPNLAYKLYRGVRGLKIHHFKMHKDKVFSFFDNDSNADDVSIDYIENKIGHLNKNKRIPKEARTSAA